MSGNADNESNQRSRCGISPCKPMNLKLLWRVAAWPIAVPVWAWSRLVLGTARVRLDGRLDAAPAIYVHWHQHLPLLMPLLGRRGCWLMMSGAPNMAPIARWAQLLGLRLVRGTSGDGGRAALARLAEIVRDGGSVELAVDGPAGPPFVAKPGCADLALATGAPIVALGYRCPSAVVTPGAGTTSSWCSPSRR